MTIHRPVKNLFLFFCLLLLSCRGWLQDSARGEDIQGPYIVNANGADSKNGSFVLRIDMFGDRDKWDEVSAPRVSTADVIDVSRKTLGALTSDSSQWQITTIELTRFFDTSYWFYLVTFEKTLSSKLWEIPVFFSGKPVKPES
jgi:hypothetical protein